MSGSTGTSATSPTPRIGDAALVGRGFTADVYAWGDGRVLKLFHPAVPRHKAEREYHATRAVARAGLPAPAVHDLVEVEGRAGVVMDRVDGPSMLERVQARPWTLFHAARELAELHARIHRDEAAAAAAADLPTLREQLAEEFDASATSTTDGKRLAREQLARLAGGSDAVAVCHGDFHPANVLYCPARGPVVIDWGRACRGDPLADVAYTSGLMRHARLPAWSPWYMHALMRFARSLLHRVYLRRSLALHGATPEHVQAWAPVLAAAGRWRQSA